MAIASASAASGDFGSAFGNRIFSITRIWFLSAWPAPPTVFFTWFGAYSATDIPNIAGASIATPRAWPSFSVATPSLLTKVCSTAASAGRKSPSTAVRPSWIAKSRCGAGPDRCQEYGWDGESAELSWGSDNAGAPQTKQKEVVIPREKRGIQYAEVSRFHRNCSGILDRPVKPGDDSGV